MRSHFGPVDLLNEALAGLTQRPTRSMLTALGTVLGVGSFVAVLGLTATASGQIDRRFSVLSATEITVEQVPQPDTDGPVLTLEFPDDAEARLRGLTGVTEAGQRWTVDPKRAGMASAFPAATTHTVVDGEQVQVSAISPGGLRVLHASFTQGTSYNDFHERRAEMVAVLGAAAARQLGITRLDSQPAVFLGGLPLTIIGIVGNVDRDPDTLFSIMVPTRTALRLWGPPARGTVPMMIIETQLGAAAQVAREAPIALRPDNQHLFRAIAPPDPRSLRQGVSSDLNVLFLVSAGVCLLVGAAGIANTTLISVLERVNEIGLRRSVGARAPHIAGQFLVESTFLGALGGLVGTSLGVIMVVVVAAARDWTAVLAPLAVWPAPLLGALTGLVAGLYPAYQASRIEPADALRR
ncbi:MAG: ABC transporter permease [Micromonosporaceae bacterium]